MPKATTTTSTKRSRRTATQPAGTGILSGISRAISSFTGNQQSPFAQFLSNTRRFTHSGVVSVGSFAWYFVTSAMVVVFPIRRAMEIDTMMEEQRQADSQRFNPDAVLPSVPGVYGSGGSGASNVPITPHY